MVKTPLQPPLAKAVASQFAYLVLMAPCVWHAASILFVGQVRVATGAVSTENEAEQLTGASQSLSTVNVTVVLPPQAGGAPELSFIKVGLQPPLVPTEASQAENLELMAACVWHAASVTVAGHVN